MPDRTPDHYCECGHGPLLHEGEYGCLGAGAEPGSPCPCRRMYPVPDDESYGDARYATTVSV